MVFIPVRQIKLDFINTKITSFEENRFDFHQELQEDFFNSYQVVGFTSYQVKNGDTIWELCRRRFFVPLWLMKKYNENLDYTRLELSSKLRVPILAGDMIISTEQSKTRWRKGRWISARPLPI